MFDLDACLLKGGYTEDGWCHPSLSLRFAVSSPQSRGHHGTFAFAMISSRVGTAETSGRAFLAPLTASLPKFLGFLVKSTSGVALSIALPTSLGLLAPMGSEPPTSSLPVSARVGRLSVFLFNWSRAVWLRAVLGNRLKASAGPAADHLTYMESYASEGSTARQSNAAAQLLSEQCK